MNVLDTLKVKPIPKQKVGFSIEVPIKVTNKISDEKYDDILTALQTNGFIKILKPKK